MTPKNGGAEDPLGSATIPEGNMVEIHETAAAANGMMEMRPLAQGLKIPANGSVELKPGSYHVMVMGLKQDLKTGSNLTLKLAFKSGKTLEPVSYTHLRAHETVLDLVCRLLLEKKNNHHTSPHS